MLQTSAEITTLPMTADEFVSELTSLGLLGEDEIRAFIAGLPSPAENAESLAKSIIRAGKLTKYQAAAVYKGQGKSLVFGDYVVLDKIGAGGMGVVLKAQHRRMKRIVAVKVLPAKGMDSQAAIQRFYRETEAAAKLIHVNIVTAFDAGEHRGMHYLVMEYVDGRDLSEMLADAGRLPVEQAVECILQAAQGLDYAHQRGVVHRDIKPANLLLAKDGTIKILDMGLARLTGENGQLRETAGAQLTESGQIMGTVDYMAPEQAMDTRTADRRADIYSLGCTLFRLLTGRNLYEDDTIMKRLMAHQQADIPSLSRARPDVPPSLDEVFRRMVAKEPGMRQQSMTELIDELQTALSASRPPQQRTREERSSDSALSEFFAGMRASRGSSGTRKKTEQPAHEPETVEYQASAEETGIQISQIGDGARGESTSAPLVERHTKVLAKKELMQRRDQRMRLWLAAVGGPLCVLSLLGLAILIVSRGEKEAEGTVPDGEVTISTGGDYAFDQDGTVDGFQLELDGTSSYCEVKSLLLDGTKPFTLEAWTTPESARAGALFSQSNSSGGVMLRKDYDGSWGVLFRDSEDWKGTKQGEADIQAGQRQHVALVFDRRTVTLFKDGVSSVSIPVSGTIAIPANATMRIGAGMQSDALGLFYDGLIDEVRISSAARYKTDFTPASRLSADSDTLALYHFDVADEAVAHDAAGGDGGTLHNCRFVPSFPQPAMATRPGRKIKVPKNALFNGRDLSGWEPVGDAGLWSVRDGILTASGDGVGWLSTAREYGNFVFEFDYRLPPGGNSGVFLRVPRSGPTSGGEFIEIALYDDNAPLGNGNHTGSIYNIAKVPPSSFLHPAGEWNSMQIRAEGSRITVMLNGQRLQVADLSAAVIPEPMAANSSRSGGFIGLQCLMTGAEFREIRLGTLP